MKELALQIKNFLLHGNIDKDNDIGRIESLTSSNLAFIAAELRSTFNDFAFKEDQSLDMVSQFANADIVRNQYLSSPQLEDFLEGLLFSQPWMSRQGCALSALINKKYKFYRNSNSEWYQGHYSWPCLIDSDHRIVIPAYTETDFLFVVCDEYFGVPDGVFNFRDLTYYMHGWSPITRHLKEGLFSMLKSIIAWYFYAKKSTRCMSDLTSEKDISKSCLLLGGALNPSHIIWNYIGGLELVTRSGNHRNIDFIVQTSELYYPLTIEESKHLKLHHMDPFRQIEELVSLGLDNSLFARLSDAGNNPKVCENIHNRSISKFALGHGVSQDILSRTENLWHPSKNKSIRIVVSIRAGRRKIVDQVSFFISIFVKLLEVVPSLEIIFDGSAAGPSSNQELEIEIAREIANGFSSQHLTIASCISFEHVIGEPMEYQSLVYKGADTYITYFSGGNAKILNFIKGIGVLMTPNSETSVKYLKKFDYMRADRTSLSQEISSFIFSENDIFVISHDYEGYSSEFLPPLLCTGEPFESSIVPSGTAGYDQHFHGDFHLDAGLVSSKLLKCISYNNLLSISFKGLPLQMPYSADVASNSL